jgi:hypothetical protein
MKIGASTLIHVKGTGSLWSRFGQILRYRTATVTSCEKIGSHIRKPLSVSVGQALSLSPANFFTASHGAGAFLIP